MILHSGFPSGTTIDKMPIKEAAEIHTFQRLLYATPDFARPINVINVAGKIWKMVSLHRLITQ